MGISKNLGILSIIFSIFSPIVSLILGIIGLSIKKEEGHYNRDITLNTIGVIMSIVSWLITLIYFL